jgi:hypothetical protein
MSSLHNDIEEFIALCQLNPFEFFEAAFGVRPQPSKQHAQVLMRELWICAPDRFEEIVNKKLKLADFVEFEKGRHFTWQQVCIVIAVYRALKGTLPAKIAIMTGRGIGKSRIVSLLMYYFLYISPKPLVMATAPTADQIYGALWKEANNVHASMRQPFKGMFVWNSDHIRRTDLPNSYYARARTANTVEAMRGEHSDQQMGIADEATGVQDEIINGGWATMNTADEKVLILITNPSGNDSLVERVFEENDSEYLKLNFSGEESPIVNQEDLAKTRAKLLSQGIKPEDDRDYCIDVLGIVPKQSATIAGYYRLFSDELIDKVLAPVTPLDTPEYRSRPAAGVDPAGEGDDEAVGVLRGFKWAKVAFKQRTSSGDSIAQSTVTLLDTNPSLLPIRTSVDAFGIGHDVSQKVLASSGEKNRYDITPVLVGQSCETPWNEKYINVRAMLYDAMRIWFQNGGRIETTETDSWRRELRSIYVKKTPTSKLQVMGKAEMKRNGLKSPNHCFVAGTMIKTPVGDVAIEQIKIGDKVLTPTGTRVVLDTQQKIVDKTYTVYTQGTSLTGTGNHRIFTQNRGLIQIDALSFTFNNDIIEVWQNRQKKMYQNLLHLMTKNSGYRQAVDTIWRTFTMEQVRLEEKRNSFIMQFGNFTTTLKSLKDFISTTKIMTPTIMTSQILNSSQQKNTGDTTKKKRELDGKKTMYIEKVKYYILLKLDRLQKNGMLQQKGLSGIKNMHSLLKKQDMKEIVFVNTVIKNSSPKVIEQNSVLTPALLIQRIIAGGIILKNSVFSVLKNLCQINSKILKLALTLALLSLEIVKIKLSLSVTSVIKKLLQPSHRNIKHVVATVTTNLGEDVVYNISVDVDKCYYANNILVSNCDALSLTFVDDAWKIITGCYIPSPTQQARNNQNNGGGANNFDPYSMIPS